MNVRLAIVRGGLLMSAWASFARADEDPAAGDVDDAGTARETLALQGTVMPRFHVVRERGGEPSETERQMVFVRRARAQLTFTPDPRIRLVVEGELMDPEQPVRDAYARYRFDRKLEVTAGYFKRPFGATELDGIWNLLTSERGLSSDLLDGAPALSTDVTGALPLTSPVAGRDVGVMISGRWKKVAGLRWAAGGWNGLGDGGLGARLSISPGPVTVGVSGGWNRATTDGLRDGAALGIDATLDSRWVFARAEGFVGSRMPVEHDRMGDVVRAQWAGGFVLAALRIPIPNACIVVQPGGKVEVLDQATDIRDDELVYLSPFVRADFGDHFRLLIEGNFLVAGENAEIGGKLVVESLVLQLGARV